MSRRLAELLVEGGLVTRREAEAALRVARRSHLRFANVLLHGGRIKPKDLSAVRRLELLCKRHPAGLHLAELLLAGGEITPADLRRAQDTRKRSGRPLGHVLVHDGFLKKRRRKRVPKRLASATVGATMLIGALGMASKPGPTKTTLPTAAAGKRGAQAPAAADERFASLADVDEQLKRLRAARRLKRPLPSSLAGQARQRAYAIRPFIEQYAEHYELPPALIYAVIERESQFNPRARSPANAVGLMQVVPRHAGHAASRYVGHHRGVPTVEDLLDPETNIRFGVAYLRLLMDQYFADVPDDEVRLALALAAYNWGPGNVRRLLQRQGVPASFEALELLLDRHAPRETRRYVRNVTRRMPAYS